jgi:tRNA A-37 threonylcarbamoyl transferase component Bud32
VRVERSAIVRTLKSSPSRSVRLEYEAHADDEAGPRTGPTQPRVVKRFAGEGLLAAPRDAARAKREYELLVHLHSLGLPVPRPLSLERRAGGWEVAMEWIQGASTLTERLAARRGDDLPARALGRLLATLQAAGIDHPDLHPGNVLLDDRERVFAIDFHKARRVPRLSAARLEAQLAHLAAGLRERASARFRALCLAAWARSLPADHPRPRGSLRELARRVDARGRRERLPTVERRRLRWMRAGSAVRAVSLTAGDGFERRDAPSGLARALEGAIEREGGNATRVLIPFSGTQPHRVLALRGSWRALSATWYAAARLEEHDLPAARPLAIARGARPWAAFALPAEGHVLSGWDALTKAAQLRGLGRLIALLHDRGLRMAKLAPEHLWVGADSAVSIACAPRLVAALDATAAQALRPWCAVLGADSEQRTQLSAGFVDALGGSQGERERVRRSLDGA